MLKSVLVDPRGFRFQGNQFAGHRFLTVAFSSRNHLHSRGAQHCQAQVIAISRDQENLDTLSFPEHGWM